MEEKNISHERVLLSPEELEAHPLKGNKSFVLRRGRMTKAQAKAHELLPDYGVASEGMIDFDCLFGRQALRVVEIGCGMGDTTVAIARNNPAIDFLAIEVFPPGIGNLISLIQAAKLDNIRIAAEDAVELFLNRLSTASIDGVHIYFPDPWPKKRHHKRRLVQTDFVHVLKKAIKPGGYIHLATDWADYAEQMVATFEPLSEFVRLPDDKARQKSMRTQTKFERKGLEKGHEIVDLIYLYQPS